jgi:crescentin
MTILSRIDRALTGANGRGRNSVGESAPSGEAMAGVIGERFETIQVGLDQLMDLARQFRTVEPLLNQMREPLEEEFQARRDGHIELINLRTAHADLAERIEPLTSENRRLSEGLATAETRLEEARAKTADQAAALVEARLELDRLRNALSQAQTQVGALETTGRHSAQRNAELENDQDALRIQLKAVEGQRTEAESACSQARRDLSLVSDENDALKRRIEEVGVEIAGLARAAASVEGQLTAERARAAAEQAESVRALRGMENQAEAARSENAALTARLDTATARAVRLEALNGEQSVQLGEVQAAARLSERRAEEVQTALDRALERVQGLEAAVEEARQRQITMESARLAAVDRAEGLTQSSAAQEKALGRSEDRLVKLQAQLASVQEEHQTRLQTLAEQNAALRAEVERVRADSAMTAAALDAARRERPGADPRPPAKSPATVQSITG